MPVVVIQYCFVLACVQILTFVLDVIAEGYGLMTGIHTDVWTLSLEFSFRFWRRPNYLQTH